MELSSDLASRSRAGRVDHELELRRPQVRDQGSRRGQDQGWFFFLLILIILIFIFFVVVVVVVRRVRGEGQEKEEGVRREGQGQEGDQGREKAQEEGRAPAGPAGPQGSQAGGQVCARRRGRHRRGRGGLDRQPIVTE